MDKPKSGAIRKDAFVNSAHPHIHLINDELRPEEFQTVFRANVAEARVYDIVHKANSADPGEHAILQETVVTLFRRENDGQRRVGIALRALEPLNEAWLGQAPDHGHLLAEPSQNALSAVQAAVEDGAYGDVEFSLVDTRAAAGVIPFAELLQRMEGARIGRSSTYGRILQKLCQENSVLEQNPEKGTVALTSQGQELAVRLKSRCGDLSSVEFALAFDQHLEDIACGDETPQKFLGWVMSLTRPGDRLAEVAVAKAWETVDELRNDQVRQEPQFGEGGGYTNTVIVDPPRPK